MIKLMMILCNCDEFLSRKLINKRYDKILPKYIQGYNIDLSSTINFSPLAKTNDLFFNLCLLTFRCLFPITFKRLIEK